MAGKKRLANNDNEYSCIFWFERSVLLILMQNVVLKQKQIRRKFGIGSCPLVPWMPL